MWQSRCYKFKFHLCRGYMTCLYLIVRHSVSQPKMAQNEPALKNLIFYNVISLCMCKHVTEFFCWKPADLPGRGLINNVLSITFYMRTHSKVKWLMIVVIYADTVFIVILKWISFSSKYWSCDQHESVLRANN